MIQTRRILAMALLLLGAQAAAGAATPEGTPMTGEQVRSLIAGNTVTGPLYAQPYEFSYEPGGRVYGTVGANTANGRWRIRPGDRYCHEWTMLFDAIERCYRWYDLGAGRYRMVNVDAYRDWDIEVWRIRPGLD